MSDEQPLAGRQILIVEDEYLIASEIADAIRHLGGTVIGPCPDVAAARQALAGSTPQGAVLDLNLKGESVVELAEELDEMRVTIVYHTGYDTTSAAEDLPRGTIIVKPTAHEVLRRQLADALCRDRWPV